ncbi:DUF1189 family protein [Fredinandcohnia sp. QZ13]|uniref:DUF1189 family protein n=1 Tax=Fredinandcohnia sp. QZ13 TaxID=3073144 RepID=UPI002853300B|nr:DUF1189 family protein [Fredinandcohnia sp. QZ13]MDR4888298.1 DUF1189 family protein [Fredinandcohnia sp. QZ13]
MMTFMDSLRLPNKAAMKRLNKLEMRHTIVFLLLLLFIIALPIEINLLLDDSYKESEIPQNIYIIQVLLFYPFLMLFLGIAGISVLAGLGVGISKLTHRQLKFQLLWKMCAFALTKSVILFAVANILIGTHWIVNTIVFVLLFYTILRMIFHYPQRVKKHT